MSIVVISQQLNYSFEVLFYTQGTSLDSGRFCLVLIEETQILVLALHVHLVSDKELNPFSLNFVIYNIKAIICTQRVIVKV